MRTKEILRRSLGASLLTSVLATAMGGCGPYPDLKVFVNGIPGDAKQLAVILWKDNMGDTTAKEMAFYDLPSPATTPGDVHSYSFGVLLEGADAHNVGYKINVAAFDPVNLPCLRLVAAGDQVPKFGLETSLTIDMPPVADFDFNNYSKSPTKRCYATPLAASMPPLIASVSIAVQRLSDANAAGPTEFLIRGWNFRPDATVNAKLGGVAKTISRKSVNSASEISISLDQVTLKEAAATNMPLSVTVTNTGGGTVTTDVTFNP